MVWKSTGGKGDIYKKKNEKRIFAADDSAIFQMRAGRDQNLTA